MTEYNNVKDAVLVNSKQIGSNGSGIQFSQNNKAHKFIKLSCRRNRTTAMSPHYAGIKQTAELIVIQRSDILV